MEKLTGEIRLSVKKQGEKTIIDDLYCQAAFKLGRPIYLDDSGELLAIVQNPGGAYFGGDTYRQEVRLSAGASLCLTAQSATKVYKCPADEVDFQGDFHLGENAVLELVNEAILPYESAKFRQHNRFYLNESSQLFVYDCLLPGWSKNGAGNHYDFLALKNEVFIEGELQLFDHLHFEPLTDKLDSFGMLGDFSRFATITVFSPKITPEVFQSLTEKIDLEKRAAEIGISQLAHQGFAVRILTDSTQLADEICQDFQRIFKELVFGKAGVLYIKR